jgi:hypothetical protein
MTNAYSEMRQMAVCCQNLLLGALSSRSAPSVLVGALFKKFGLFLNTPRTHLPAPGYRRVPTLLTFAYRSTVESILLHDYRLSVPIYCLLSLIFLLV